MTQYQLSLPALWPYFTLYGGGTGLVQGYHNLGIYKALGVGYKNADSRASLSEAGPELPAGLELSQAGALGPTGF